MMKPTIHNNGTSRDELMAQVLKATERIREAMTALAEATPNGRDYYPQGPDAIKAAGAEHRERIAKLREVLDDMEALSLHICDA